MGMNEFLERLYGNLVSDRQLYAKEIVENDLFEFLWERGAKQFVKDCSKEASLQDLINSANGYFNGEFEINAFTETAREIVDAQDFLDCLACLGEDKVKELIKELKEGVKE